MKQCVLEDKICTHCGECEKCDLDPNKVCDNCGKCIESNADFNGIKIDKVILNL